MLSVWLVKKAEFLIIASCFMKKNIPVLKSEMVNSYGSQYIIKVLQSRP